MVYIQINLAYYSVHNTLTCQVLMFWETLWRDYMPVDQYFKNVPKSDVSQTYRYIVNILNNICY